MPRNSTVGVRRSAFPQVSGLADSAGARPRVLSSVPMAATMAAMLRSNRLRCLALS